MPTLTTDQLRALARHGAKARLQELHKELAAIEALLGEGRHPGAPRGRRPGRLAGRVSKRSRGRRPGKLSAAGRRAIAAAQRARWAKIKAANGEGKSAERQTRKRRATKK